MASLVLRTGVVLAGLLGILLALDYALDRRVPSIVAHNGANPVEFGPRVEGGQRLCASLGRVEGEQPGEAVQVTIGTYGEKPPALRLAVLDDETGQRAARVFRGYQEGVVTIPLPAGTERGGSRACFTNLGAVDIVFAGQRTAQGDGSPIDRKPTDIAVSLRLITGSPKRWSSVTGTVVERIGYGRGESGNGDSGYLVLVLFGAAFAAALGAAWRWAR